MCTACRILFSEHLKEWFKGTCPSFRLIVRPQFASEGKKRRRPYLGTTSTRGMQKMLVFCEQNILSMCTENISFHVHRKCKFCAHEAGLCACMHARLNTAAQLRFGRSTSRMRRVHICDTWSGICQASYLLFVSLGHILVVCLRLSGLLDYY